MSDAGYTLTETLAAMAVLGLGMGGFSLGMQVHAAQQRRVGELVGEAQSARAAQVWLQDRLVAGAPFGARAPGRMTGGTDRVRFACGGAEACSAQLEAGETGARLTLTDGSGGVRRLSLPAPDARFAYMTLEGEGDAWPQAAPAPQPLRAVAVVAGEGPSRRALLVAKVRAEQPLDCAFDPILQDCR